MTEKFVKHQNSEHFDLHHEENGEVLVCLSHNGQCSVLVEISSEYNDEEKSLFVESTERALDAVDSFMDGKSADYFGGLHIKIGEGLTEGGAEALPGENRIVLNGRKMILSIAEMRTASGMYSKDELNKLPINENQPVGALEYTLVHEMGHILDELTEQGSPRHRVAAVESPTKYGKEPDNWHKEKDHEAFAEGFAHLVYGAPVSQKLEVAVKETMALRLDEASASS